MQQGSLFEAWTAELQADRRVDIWPRGRRLKHLLGVALPIALCMYVVIDNKTTVDRRQALFYLGLIGLGILIPRGLWILYRAAKPMVLSVSPNGVQLGKRRFDWSQIRHISLRQATPFLRNTGIGKSVVRLDGDHGSQKIEVTHEHVEDLEAFHDWLRTTHAHRTNHAD